MTFVSSSAFFERSARGKGGVEGATNIQLGFPHLFSTWRILVYIHRVAAVLMCDGLVIDGMSDTRRFPTHSEYLVIRLHKLAEAVMNPTNEYYAVTMYLLESSTKSIPKRGCESIQSYAVQIGNVGTITGPSLRSY